MKRAIVDLDGILAAFNEAAHAILSAHGPMKALEVDGPSCWDWYEEYGAVPAGLLTLKQQMHTAAFWRSLDVHRDAATPEVINSLSELMGNTEVSFVTARPVGRNATALWLMDNFYTPYPTIVLTPGAKLAALMAMHPSVIIEDNGPTLRDYALAVACNTVPPCTNILVKRPYNQAYWSTPGITPVNTTGEALTLALEVTR